VLLYELLTGTTPFDQPRIRAAAFDEIRRVIREEEPPKPSLRISTLGEQRTVTASHRKVEAAELSRILRGDLDWIVMKSLEKDRSRRYETANGLARDIDRYLHNQPVEASPPSALYRFRKFARRNRGGLTVAMLLTAALVTGTAVSTWQAVRATRAERVAEVERSEAEANFQKARAAVDTYFTQVSESTLLDVPGLQPLRMRLMNAALDFYRGFADEHVRDPAVLADLAVTYMRVAEIYHANDRNDDAVAAINHALVVIDRLRREFPDARNQHRRMAGYWTGERQLRVSTELPKDPQAALGSMNRLIENWRALADDNPDELAFRRDLAGLYNRTGDLLESAGQPAEAVAYIAQAIVVLEKLTHDNPEMPAYRADLAQSYEYLARYLPQIGRTEEAESNARKALAIRKQLFVESPQVTQYLAELAFSLLQVASSVADRDPAEAEKLFRRALEITEQLLAASPAVPMHFKRWSDASNGLVDLLARTGRQAESDAHRLHAMQFMQQVQIDNPSEVIEISLADSIFNHGITLFDNGQRQQALPLLQKVAAVYEKVADQPDSPALVRYHLGHCYRRIDGVNNNRKAVALFAQLVKEDPSREDYKGCLAWAEDGLAKSLANEKDFAAAEASYRHAIDLYQQLVAEFPGTERYLVVLAELRANYGNMLAAAGRMEEAQMARRAAMENCHQLAKNRPQDASQRYHHLGDLFAECNQTDDAIMCFRRAIELTPNSWASHHALADQLRSRGQEDEAIAHYREAISLNPSFAWSHTNLSGLLAKQGELEEAIAEAKTAAGVAHSAHDADAEYGALSALSAPLNRLGDKKKELLVFRECVAATPHSEMARYFLATALGQQNLDQEAVVELREAIQIKLQWEFPRLKLVEELLKMGQPEEALAETQAIRIANDKGAWPRIWFGRLLARQGMYDAAVESLLAAMEKEPDNQMPFDELRNLVVGFQDAQAQQHLVAKIDKAIAGTRYASDWLTFRERSADSSSEASNRDGPKAND